MNKKLAVAVAGVALGATLVGATAATAAHATGTGTGPVAAALAALAATGGTGGTGGTGANAFQCRTGTLNPTPDLTAVITACGRYAGGWWEERASVRVQARNRTVKGKLFTYEITDRSGTPQYFDFTAEPGGQQAVPIATVNKRATASEKSAYWAVGVQLPGAGSVITRLYSPVVQRAAGVSAPKSGGGGLARICAENEDVRSDATVQLDVVRACALETGGVLKVSAMPVKLRATARTQVVVRLLVDGKPVSTWSQSVPATAGKQVTVTAPAFAPALLQGEKRAVFRISAGTVTTDLPAIQLR